MKKQTLFSMLSTETMLLGKEKVNTEGLFGLFKKKEPEMISYRCNFLLSRYNDSDFIVTNIDDLKLIITGEDKDSGFCNAAYNIIDNSYEYFDSKNGKGYNNLDVIGNLKYWLRIGEESSLQCIKNNLNKKTEEYIFKIPKGLTKQEFIDKIKNDTFIKSLRLFEDLMNEVLEAGNTGPEYADVNTIKKRYKDIENLVNPTIKKLEQVMGQVYDKITRSPKVNQHEKD